jgi:ribose transport system permease protein
VFASVLAAIAGILSTGTAGAADPTTGPTYLLPAFAAAFLGSTAITPGRFNPIGTFCAVYFLQTGVAGLELVGLSGWVDQVFYGGSLVVAVALPRLLGGRVAGLRDD